LGFASHQESPDRPRARYLPGRLIELFAYVSFVDYCTWKNSALGGHTGAHTLYVQGFMPTLRWPDLDVDECHARMPERRSARRTAFAAVS